MAEKINPAMEPDRPHHLLRKEETLAPSKEPEASGKGQEASCKELDAPVRRKINPRPADPNRLGFPTGFSFPKKKLSPFKRQGVSSPKRVVTTPAGTTEHDVTTPAVTPDYDVSSPASTPDQDD